MGRSEHELRCPFCGRLIATTTTPDARLTVKCPRCKRLMQPKVVESR
jgi:phage FluMu protein Com